MGTDIPVSVKQLWINNRFRRYNKISNIKYNNADTVESFRGKEYNHQAGRYIICTLIKIRQHQLEGLKILKDQVKIIILITKAPAHLNTEILLTRWRIKCVLPPH